MTTPSEGTETERGRRPVLAVDGGGSAMRIAVHTDATVEVDAVRRGPDAIEATAAAVLEGWRRLGSPSVDRVVVGLTTAPADPTDADRLGRLVAGVTEATDVWIADDAVTAHSGALSMGWGVSVIAGTGVACLSMPRAGSPRIVGGYGSLLGDEGGAWWIGREGVRSVLRGRDGREPPSGLEAAARRRFGNLDDVHVRLHDDPGAVDVIAQFARDVVDAAAEGLPAATAIVDGAARELLELATAAAVDAGGTSADPVPLALGGRLLGEGTALRARLDERIARTAAPLSPRSACGSPLDGARLLGLEPDPGRYTPLVHVWRNDREVAP
jgi:N-acetylglucosamine kinase-like BadF-type ATPase